MFLATTCYTTAGLREAWHPAHQFHHQERHTAQPAKRHLSRPHNPNPPINLSNHAYPPTSTEARLTVSGFCYRFI